MIYLTIAIKRGNSYLVELILIKKKYFWNVEMLEPFSLKTLSLILQILLKELSNSFEKLGQWRRWWPFASLLPQLQIGFKGAL